ncbi:MAG: calcium-binding protein [Thiobacillus sp.]|nr:calcium-binding protein [Thiobacillus sp.]
MAGYWWHDINWNILAGATTGNDVLAPIDPTNALASFDGKAGSDTFDFGYWVNIANFTITNNVDGSVTVSGASNGHNLNVKLVNFEKIAYTDKSGGAHTITLSGGGGGGPTAGNDTLNGTSAANTLNGLAGNDTLNGNGGNDVLNGGTGNDKLNGGTGNDKLLGSTGKDTLTGGTGADKFVFNSAPNATTNLDTIKDFVHGTDKVQLDDDIFTALGAGTSAGVALSAAKFFAGSAAHDSSDRIIYHKATGSLFYDPDGTGAQAQIKVAVLGGTTHPSLTASDLQVIA